MVEIGGRPILWHIMNICSVHGINEFLIALGYKGEIVKEYFLNFYAINNDISIDLSTGTTTIHDGNQPNWKIHLLDTGLHTQTGGRLRRLRSWLKNEESFLFTYGDGVTDLDIGALVRFHQSHKRLATVTIVRSPERFGRIALDGSQIMNFYEKPETSDGWINGGYFVLSPKVIDYVDGDETVWERNPVQKLAADGEFMAFQHSGFWSCMDTLKEKNYLEDLWRSERAPWMVWRQPPPSFGEAGHKIRS
jgi:glucose-1-phosphate cytidylyltransferase